MLLSHVRVPSFAEPLLEWYDQHARILPWRSMPTPYRVWISEIMLQQTRVEAVRPYFERFIVALPDVPSLAAVDETTLLKLWEGLGYYNRARNLQKAARKMVEQYGGELPASYEELLNLPGIGEYTAGAIASIAFDIAVPAVDGNVMRAISRLLASGEDISDLNVRKALRQQVVSMLPSTRVGDFNQALMELGATVCIPKRPRCENCPIQTICEAKQQEIAHLLPVKAPKASRLVEEHTVLFIIAEGKLLLRPRPSKGLLAGLWEPPNLNGWLDREEVEALLAKWGIEPQSLDGLEDGRHVFTHREWLMRGYYVQCRITEPPDTYCWIDLKDLGTQVPMPRAFQCFTKQLFEDKL